MPDKRQPAIVVHGGAGRWPEDKRVAALVGCRQAVAAGLAVLAEGGSSMDAAQAAVVVLERDPAFNAGLGSVLTRDGTVEVDAAVMDGRDRRIGAIAAVARVDRPIEVARAVFEDGEHALLCGVGAQHFAVERGFALSTDDALVTERAKRRLATVAAARQRGESQVVDPGTVGAVVVDADGHVAAATSTGGTTYKRAGRIGDTPLAGCGTYADDRSGAASATGHGESIIRGTMTRVCCDAMARGMTASEAAHHAVRETTEAATCEVGVIAVDRHGGIGAAHGTPRMAWGAGVLLADGTCATSAGLTVEAGEAIRVEPSRPRDEPE